MKGNAAQGGMWTNVAIDILFQVLQYSCSFVRKFENPSGVTFEALCITKWHSHITKRKKIQLNNDKTMSVLKNFKLNKHTDTLNVG